MAPPPTLRTHSFKSLESGDRIWRPDLLIHFRFIQIRKHSRLTSRNTLEILNRLIPDQVPDRSISEGKPRMPIVFHCSECYAQVITPDETAGKQGRCTNCSAVLIIPHQSAPQSDSHQSKTAQPPTSQTAASPASSGRPGGIVHQSSHATGGAATTRNQDPFKPTGKKKKSTAPPSESLETQFGSDTFEPADQDAQWGEDLTLEEQLEKQAAQDLTRRRIHGAAQALLITGSVSLILVAIGILALISYVIYHAQNSIEIEILPSVLWTLVISVALITSTMIVIGANHMLKVRSYSMAYTGVVFAILPLNPLFFLTIPFGISALITLNDQRLAEGFKRR